MSIFDDSLTLQLYWHDNIPLEERKPYTIEKKLPLILLLENLLEKK